MKIVVVNLAVPLIALLMFPANALSQAGSSHAAPDEYDNVVFPVNCVDATTHEPHSTQLRLGFQKLAWDKDGKLVDARGLKPIIEQLDGPTLKIVSDLKRPSLKDGILTLTIDGQPDVAGKVDIPFVISYGRTGIVPPQNVLACSSGCCLVAH